MSQRVTVRPGLFFVSQAVVGGVSRCLGTNLPQSGPGTPQGDGWRHLPEVVRLPRECGNMVPRAGMVDLLNGRTVMTFLSDGCRTVTAGNDSGQQCSARPHITSTPSEQPEGVAHR